MHASLSLTHTQHTHMRYILGLNGHFARAKEREDMMEEERSRALMLSDSCRAEAQALAVTHMPTHTHSLSDTHIYTSICACARANTQAAIEKMHVRYTIPTIPHRPLRYALLPLRYALLPPPSLYALVGV